MPPGSTHHTTVSSPQQPADPPPPPKPCKPACKAGPAETMKHGLRKAQVLCRPSAATCRLHGTGRAMPVLCSVFPARLYPARLAHREVRGTRCAWLLLQAQVHHALRARLRRGGRENRSVSTVQPSKAQSPKSLPPAMPVLDRPRTVRELRIGPTGYAHLPHMIGKSGTLSRGGGWGGGFRGSTPTCDTDTMTGAAAVSMATVSSSSSSSGPSSEEPWVTLTLGTRVLRSAARLAMLSASRTLPPSLRTSASTKTCQHVLPVTMHSCFRSRPAPAAAHGARASSHTLTPARSGTHAPPQPQGRAHVSFPTHRPQRARQDKVRNTPMASKPQRM